MKKVYLFSAILFSIFLYLDSSAQAPNTWTQKANFGGSARYYAVGFSTGGKGYIGTGEDSYGNEFSDFWEYDTTANAWTQKANFGGGTRIRAVGFSIGGKGYIGTGGSYGIRKNDFWEYDTTTNAWKLKANFGGGVRLDAVAFSIGAKGYIGTGLGSGGYYSNDFWEYDTTANDWTQKANFGGSPRYGAVGFSIGDKGYIGTGLSENSDYTDHYNNDFWEYDPNTNAWTQKANFGGSARYYAVGFSIWTKGYIGTGSDLNGNWKNDFWEYDTTANAWTQKANFGGSPRASAVGFSIGDQGYIGTGVGINGILYNDFWQYTPSCILPVPPTNTTPPANQNICTGNSTTLSASGPGTLGWYSAPTGGTWLGGGSTFTTPILATSTTYYVQDSTCGPSQTRTNIPVIVNPLPVPTITGQTSMCVNSGYYNYTTEAGMSNYVWTVSSGGIINYGSGTYQIQVSWIIAGPQTVSVTYTSAAGCNPVTPTVLNVTVNPLPGPAGAITGAANVCAGANGVAYSVAPIPNTTVYIWSLPPNDTIASGAGLNSITVDFAANATSGDINVYGNNLCGDGPVSPNLFITVNPIPPTPVVINNGDALQSSAPAGNQWYFQGTLIQGATSRDYIATQDGYYWDVVTLNGCSSDTSNHKLIIITGINAYYAPVIDLYPVPNDGKFNLTISTTSRTSFTISVYNSLGVRIYEDANVDVDGTLQKLIDLRPCSDGIYIIVFKDSSWEVVRKIVVGLE
jgi:N-acetylneuraminic acid mutarotase